MGLGASKFLGLAIKDRSILAAEVRVSGNSRGVSHTAEFLFPADTSWEKPEPLGTALRQFLRQNHFSASSAVIGVPARWLMAREKDVPPATAQVAAAALRLQAERLFSLEAKDLVFDYAGESDPRQTRRVLVLAMLRPHVQRLETLADTAGLRAVAVTSATLVLAAAMAQSPATGSSLMLGADSAELLIRDAGVPRLLKYLPVSGLSGGENGSAAACLAALSAEVKRAVTLMPVGSGPLRSLELWDGVGLDSTQASSMGERTGLDIRRGDQLSLLGVASTNGSGGDGGRFGAAVALGLAGAIPELRGIDFLHSRLAAVKQRRIGRGTLWAAAAVAVVALGLGSLVYDVQRQKNKLEGIRAELAALEPERKAAEEIATRVKSASKWYAPRPPEYPGRPPYMACLRDITQAFPQDGNSIWASTLSIREDCKCTLTGQAVNEGYATQVMDSLKRSKLFTDVKLEWRREGQGRDNTRREATFTFNFTYKGAE